MNQTRGSFFVGLSAALVPVAARAAAVTSVSLALRNNRIYASFGVPTASGAREEVEFAVDTGGGALVIARKTAARLGLKMQPRKSDKPSSFVPIALETVYVGGTRIPLGFAATTVADTDQYAPGAASAGFFAGAFLGDHIVTYDYLNGALLLDGPPVDGGVPQALRIDPKSGFPRIELTIDGETYGFLLDTGASFTMLSNAVVERLRNKHPEWPYVLGAYGPANMMGGPEIRGAMMRMRDVRWGDIRLGDVDVVTRNTGTFENYMSSITAGNIVGALGGNVLRNVAARLDYPHATLTVRYQPRPRPDELTVVPLILEPHDDGTFTISGGTAAAGLTDKQLISVDRHPVVGRSMDDVQQMLRGPVGAARSIEVPGEHPVERKIVAIL